MSSQPPGVVRVATYNLYLGADLSLVLDVAGAPGSGQESAFNEVLRQLKTTAFPQRVDALAAVIAKARPDLLGLQEVCTWTLAGAPLWDFEPLLVAALERLGQPFEVVTSIPTFVGSASAGLVGLDGELSVVGSNVILRRSAAEISAAPAGQGLFDTALELDALFGARVRIARGFCSAAVVSSQGSSFRFVNTHTEAYAKASRDAQRDELLRALGVAASSPGEERDPLLLVGDFNAPPEMVGLSSAFHDAWAISDDQPGPTCGQAADLSNDESLLSERIDYIWTRGLRPRSAGRFGHLLEDRTKQGMWPSDHAGVWADVELPSH